MISLEFWYTDEEGRYNLDWAAAQTACETYLHTTVATVEEMDPLRQAGRYSKEKSPILSDRLAGIVNISKYQIVDRLEGIVNIR